MIYQQLFSILEDILQNLKLTTSLLYQTHKVIKAAIQVMKLSYQRHIVHYPGIVIFFDDAWKLVQLLLYVLLKALYLDACALLNPH